VEDGADVVLVEGAREGLVVGQLGADLDAALGDALGVEARVWVDVAQQGDDAGLFLEQALGEPGADESLGARDEDGDILPAGQRAASTRVRQGARPWSQSSFSRSVSL
jgi:hypothetical protein